MDISKTMKAAVVERFGAPLVVREVPIPTPGPGQALVEISANTECVIPICTRPTVIGQSNQRFLSCRDGAARG